MSLIEAIQRMASVATVLALFTTGSVYAQQAEDPVTCPNDNTIVPMSYGQHTTGCNLLNASDVHRFQIDAVAGDDIRFTVASLGNFMDPKLVVRDPDNAVVAEQFCNDSCAFRLPYVAQDSGTHTLFLTDNNTQTPGEYTLQIERYAPADASAQVLAYDDPVSDSVDPITDADFFRFYALSASEVRINAASLGNFMDPTVEVRRPDGSVIVDGVIDGGTCNDSCAFSVDVLPDVTGWYSLVIYDRNSFSAGGYEVSLWCIAGACDSDGDGTADPEGPMLSYVTTVAGDIESTVDSDTFRINGTVGTEVRLSALSIGDFMDPTFELRDPNNAVVINGVADGASCLDSCAFSVDFTPTLDGIYRLLIRDRTLVSTGSYDVAMWCVSGACDSDADGVVDGDVRVSYTTPAVLSYGSVATDEIEPGIDADVFIFGGTQNDLINIAVTSFGNFMDPTIEIRDPNNVLVIDGENDGASCLDSCSFNFEFTPSVTGTYSLLIRDRTGVTAGDYTVQVSCLIGSCTDVVAVCGDNCIDVPNGPLIPDAGGNIQLDTDGDGQGNFCDADFDQSGAVNFLDIAEWSDNFLSSNALYDINGDGVVNFIDLSLVAERFLQPPGPSCSSPVSIGAAREQSR